MNALRKYRKALLITLATVLVLAACPLSFFAGAILHSATVVRETLEYYVGWPRVVTFTGRVMWKNGVHGRVLADVAFGATFACGNRGF
jgi:hypothetical protein